MKKPIYILKNSVKGNALLLAMLIMSSIVVVSAGTSRLILNEFSQSFQLDKAAIAYYAAESGVEKSLYELRRQNFSVDDLNGQNIELDNNASYQLVVKNYEDVIYTSLKTNETYQLDLFVPESLTGFEAGQEIKSLIISWQGEGSWLEIKWSAWKTTGQINDNLGQLYTGGQYLSQVSSPAVIQLYNDNTYLYRLRLSARNASASNIVINAYNVLNPYDCEPISSCQVPIIGRLSLKAIGEFPDDANNASRQAIIATMPQKSPLSNFYDYVIFSEEAIQKE